MLKTVYQYSVKGQDKVRRYIQTDDQTKKCGVKGDVSSPQKKQQNANRLIKTEYKFDFDFEMEERPSEHSNIKIIPYKD
ncbi:hypothetical protein STEG23_006372 [Scotinomys teguina]